MQIGGTKHFLPLDALATLLIICQAWCVVWYSHSSHVTFVHIVNVVMPFCHAADMALRIHIVGFNTYVFDPRGPTHYLKSQCALGLSATGLSAAIAFIFGQWVEVVQDIDSAWVRILQAGTVLPMIRVLMLPESFRDLTVGFLRGLMVVRQTFLLLAMVFYFYCVVAYNLFKDIDVNKSATFTSVSNFSSLFEAGLISQSQLTQSQIWLHRHDMAA